MPLLQDYANTVTQQQSHARKCARMRNTGANAQPEIHLGFVQLVFSFAAPLVN